MKVVQIMKAGKINKTRLKRLRRTLSEMQTPQLFIIYNLHYLTPACQATQKQLATLLWCTKRPFSPLEAPRWAGQRRSLSGWWDEATALGAAGRRTRGEEIEGGVEKSLPRWWDEATTLESCRWETSWLGKSRKCGVNKAWKTVGKKTPTNFPAEPLSCCQLRAFSTFERRFPPTYFPQESLSIWLYACRSSRTRREAIITTPTTTSTTSPTAKTQTIDLSALWFCLSEVLRVLEPRAWTILKLMYQFWQPLLCGLAVVVILQRNSP